MKDNKEILVALAGNPNSGKTSLFNKLVGANQKVGNWSGVTVEKYEGKTKHRGYNIKVIDLPGTYSLTTYSPEEKIARYFIIEEKPDVIINVVDSTNLDRNLYLTTQLIDMQTNLLVAFNMIDEVEKKQTKIDFDQLEELLGAHLIPTSSVSGKGISLILDHIVELHTGKISVKRNKLNFSGHIENYIDQLTAILETDEEFSQKYNPRWLAIKLLVNDKDVYNLIREHPVWIKTNPVLLEAIKKTRSEYDEEIEIKLNEERFSFIKGALKETVEYASKIKRTPTEIIDSILINRITGLPIFAFFMWIIFQLTFTLGEYPMNWLEASFSWLSENANLIIPEGIARSIIVDGIIAGVGGVIVFLPNIMILFLALAFLEGTGYMARAAFVIDRIMHKIGLHGKSFIPMITGFGCSVPAFMATRTLKNEGDRITTLLIIPFMSCGAKFPVYVLIAGTFFETNMAGNILFAIYVFGVIVALISAKFLKSTLFHGISEPFVMELPPYRMPLLKTLLIQMWYKATLYLKKAGTIILLAAILIWFASNYPKNLDIEKYYQDKIQLVKLNEQLNDDERNLAIKELVNKESAEQIQYSLIGRIGYLIEPIVKPLGFDWKLGVSLVTGIAAKEIVVSTMGTLYALGDTNESSSALREQLLSNPNYNQAVALAFMIFVLLYIPCFAASIVFHREAGRWKWTLLYAVYTTFTAWILALIIYNLSKLIIL
ncbi:ferrous iron transport protein B [Bacteroidota bacterium]